MIPSFPMTTAERMAAFCKRYEVEPCKLRYSRRAGQTEVKIRTDWQTTESVRLKHPGSDDPSRWFLIERQPFTAADWPRIELAPGRLRPGLRVAAWVCDDGRNATLDWAPPRAP